MWRTGRGVGIVAGEGHFGLEVAAVVERVLVEHDERYAPLKDVLVDQLGVVSWVLCVFGCHGVAAFCPYADCLPLYSSTSPC